MEHEVTEQILASGARGLVIHVPGTSVVNMEVEFSSGFMFGSKAKFEVPHVLEHLMAGDGEFVIEAEKNGAYRNAMTNQYINGYVYECADFEKERILELMGRQLTHPKLTEAELEKETKAVAEELSRNLSNYPRLAYWNLAAHTMPKRSLQEGRRLKQLQKIALEDVASYYSLTHTHNNMRFYFAGDLPDGGRDLIARFDELIKPLPQGQALKTPAEPEVKLSAPLLIKKPIPQVYYFLQTYADGLDYRQRLALGMLRALMTGGYRSWLFGPVRQRGLAYHVASSFWTDEVISAFEFHAYATPNNLGEVFELFRGAYLKAMEGDFSAEDLEGARTAMKGRLLRSNQTAADLLDWYSGPYSQEHRILQFDQFLNDIETITKEEVVAAARYMAAENRWGLSLVGNIDKSQAQKLYDILKPIWSQH